MTDEEPLQAGDRVVHLQIPGVCTVVARRGKFLEVANGAKAGCPISRLLKAEITMEAMLEA